MADFIPGEGYRLDVLGADDSVLVDSWAGHIKADVVDINGNIQVDTVSGKLYGPLIGDIQDIDGSVLYDSTLNKFKVDVQGDVLDSTGEVLLDGLTKTLMGDVQGHIIGADGGTIVDYQNNEIRADAIYGTFFGDLEGNITSSGTIVGTFSGDFNGTSYGDFFGDVTGNTTGNHTGNVVGNLLGNVTGNVLGNLQSTETTLDITLYSAELAQHLWLGGVAHPDDTGAPVLKLGATKEDTYLTANVSNLDGSPAVQLTDTGATFHGKLIGGIGDGQGTNVLSLTDTNLNLYHNNIDLLGDEKISFRSPYIEKHFMIGDVDPKEVIYSYKGTFDNKTALSPGDIAYSTSVEIYDGTGFKEIGNIGFAVDPVKTINTNNNFAPGVFVISLSNGTQDPSSSNPNMFVFDNAGKFTAPSMKLGSTTFAQRDSMTAEEGTIIFNSSSKKFQGYTGTTWVDLH